MLHRHSSIVPFTCSSALNPFILLSLIFRHVKSTPCQERKGSSSNKESCANSFSILPNERKLKVNHGRSSDRGYIWQLQSPSWVQICNVIIWPRWKRSGWFKAQGHRQAVQGVYTVRCARLSLELKNDTFVSEKCKEHMLHRGISWSFQYLLGSIIIPGGHWIHSDTNWKKKNLILTTSLETQSRCGKLDKISKGAGSMTGILAHEVICKHDIR